MLLTYLLDRLLRLLPGHRNNPASLEARIRRGADAYVKTVSKAIDQEQAIQTSVNQDIAVAAEAAAQSARAALRRHADLVELLAR